MTPPKKYEWIRGILAIPLIATGTIFYWTAELVAGKKYAFRSDEVLEILNASAECTKCGHRGRAFIKPAPTNTKTV